MAKHRKKLTDEEVYSILTSYFLDGVTRDELYQEWDLSETLLYRITLPEEKLGQDDRYTSVRRKFFADQKRKTLGLVKDPEAAGQEELLFHAEVSTEKTDKGTKICLKVFSANLHFLRSLT